MNSEHLSETALHRVSDRVAGWWTWFAGLGGNHRSKSAIILVERGNASVPAIVEDDLPDDAYRSLLMIDPFTVGAGPLQFDRRRREWRRAPGRLESVSLDAGPGAGREVHRSGALPRQ